MKKTNKLDLNYFFYNLKDMNYVIIKYDTSFPNYYSGSDIDIFCYNKNEFAKQVLNYGNKYLNRGFEIKVKNLSNNHTFIDFFQNNELDFRFDLYDSFPNYKKIKIKKYYLYSVIENAFSIIKKYNGIEYYIFIPSDIDNILLRYIEYIEWYELRPDKIKHLDYILDKLSKNSLSIKFIDKLHLYVEFPEPNFDNNSNNLSNKRNFCKLQFSILRFLNNFVIDFFRRLRKFLGKFYFIRKIYFKIHKRNKN